MNRHNIPWFTNGHQDDFTLETDYHDVRYGIP